MANETRQGACRFCGQQLIVDNAAEMTEAQLEEAATMRCDCDSAKGYQEVATRRKTAKKRAQELFGEGAGQFAQSEGMLALINDAIDCVCDKDAKQIVLTIRTGLKCRIMAMAKDKIKIVRETSGVDVFEQ